MTCKECESKEKQIEVLAKRAAAYHEGLVKVGELALAARVKATNLSLVPKEED